jgi:anti-anti-sigma factor
VTALDTSVAPAGDHTLLRVAGEVDLANAAELERAVAGALGDRGGTLVVDLAELAYIDSAGLAALHGATRQLEARGGSVVLVVPDDCPCARTFAVAALPWPVAAAWPGSG